MKFLNNLIRIIIFIIWSMLIFYLAKQMGITYDPDDQSVWRTFFRVLAIVVIFGGAYFIWKINFFNRRQD